jgi:hypothetical protein
VRVFEAASAYLDIAPSRGDFEGMGITVVQSRGRWKFG